MHAKYTVVLRDIMENEMSRHHLDKALSTYPLYFPLYYPDITYVLHPTREQLNDKLLNHYKYREIGFETVGRFLDELEITMCEIMPRYNELLKTIEIMQRLPNPFDNVDVTESYEEVRRHVSESSGSSTSNQSGSGTSKESGEGSASQTANGKLIESDTPQDSLSIGADGINEVDYASKAQWNEDNMDSYSSNESTRTTNTTNEETGSSTSSVESSDIVSHTYTKKGNQGVNTYAHDMNEYRTAIIDVVEQIINDSRIAELFMMVY